MIVKLTQDEMEHAAFSGMKRKITSIFGHYKDTTDQPTEEYLSFDYDIYGAAAEMAFAKSINKYWNGCSQLSKTDVDKFQVRITLHPKGRLILRSKDNPEHIFIHTKRISFDEIEIIGYIKAVNGMKPEYLIDPSKKNRPPAWFVPDSILLPFKEK